MPLNSCVCAHVWRYVEARILELGLPGPRVGRFYTLINTAKCPFKKWLCQFSLPPRGYERPVSLHPGQCWTSSIFYISANLLGDNFFFFQPSGSFTPPSTCSAQASSCWQPKTICWRQNEVKAKMAYFLFSGKGVYLGKCGTSKVSRWFERWRSKIQEVPCVVLFLNPGAPLH